MSKNQGKDSVTDWSKVFESMDLSVPYYVRKENPEEGRYRISNIAKDFFNPEKTIVTFYDLLSADGTIHYLTQEVFEEQFERNQK